jgi:subtilisin family serine protease
VKRRNRLNRRRWLSRSTPLQVFAERNSRKRKTFSFETLEERLAFSAESPTSSTTADVDWQRELQWSVVQAAAGATNGTAPLYGLMAIPNDPFIADPSDPDKQGQWHLWNIGQPVGNPDLQDLFGVPGEDINVIPVWQGTGLEQPYTGDGVVVAVFDSGVQLFHPDLVGNIHPTLRLNATTGTISASPSLIDPLGYHGTAVAGLIGATADNGIGGSGVAPGVILVPIRRDFTNALEEEVAFQWAIQNDIDITNNSWGPVHEFNRLAFPLTPNEAEILRSSVIFGRNGLGMIHVFASGNFGGPSFSPGFDVAIGNYDSSSYNAWANSRYTITVTGVDQDGMYLNPDDGTFTSYPSVGPNVLVAAPTGSTGLITVAEDSGYGSGIWTTDLVGDFGNNAAPLPGGFDPDSDPWPDPDYTSRFNGTSAATPLVSGVVALMLEANPNLTYRDVQSILMRSARQNAQFETPSSGALVGPRTTWQTNQIGPFRDPDVWIPNSGQSPVQSIFNPLADPNNEGIFGGQNFAPDAFDGGRQAGSHYEPQPGLFMNGAGYTVSQGYGVYSEQTGYGHGVVDAELAVWMAERWHTLGQNVDRLTEKTFTSGIVSFGDGLNIPAAEKMADDNGAMLVPGGIGGLGGFIGYWNEYFADDDPVDLTDGPFSQDDPPVNTRGFSYLDFAVPPAEGMSIEWVEVKLDIEGPSEDLDFLRIMLTSPEGTQSEFMEFWADPEIDTPLSLQAISAPGDAGTFLWRVDPAGDIDADLDGGGTWNWTFSTNRSWGESSNTSVIIDPVTGEPLLAETFGGAPFAPIFRDWEVHIENWSNSDFALRGVEVVWHGKPIEGGSLDPNWNVTAAQRVQGFVGVDTNNDEQFNFRRSLQSVVDTDGDPDTIRLLDVTRQQDFTDNNFNGIYDTGDVINQEPFASNVLVEAYRVINPDSPDEFVETTPSAQFLTGADGNYYFDLDPTQTYEIRITDLSGLPRIALDDVTTPGQAPPGFDYAPHFLSSWRITPDWFFAPDRDNPIVPGNEPGEIFWGQTDANGDGTFTEGPLPFLDVGAAVPMAVKNVNFLLKQDALPDQVEITGTVYLDADADGDFTPAVDTPLPGVRMYVDANRNEAFDVGEDFVDTAADGSYTFTITTATAATFAVGVDPNSSPTSLWESTQPGGLNKSVFLNPGESATVDFFLAEPDDDTPGVQVGNIVGFVFNDLDADGIRDPAELGVEGVRVFVDTDEDGVFDNDGDALLEAGEEIGALSNSNGSYFLQSVPSGTHRVTVLTTGTSYVPTVPSSGVRTVVLNNGQTLTGILFGLENLADSDWGDLPDSYSTLDGSNGPRHFIQQHFRLGANISGEVNGQPSAGANTDTSDDGVVVVGGTLVAGVNTLQVTVNGVGGSLTGWIDWNMNGTFEANERLIWSQNGSSLGGEADLGPGMHNLQITSPGVLGPVAARFRWGEAGLDFFGPAAIGEVEDYYLASSNVVAILAGDYNSDGNVDSADYVVWRRHNNTNTVLPNDSTPGTVSQEDFTVWKANYGNTSLGGGGGAVAGESSMGPESNLPSSPGGSAALAANPYTTTNSSAVVKSIPKLSFQQILAMFEPRYANPSLPQSSAASSIGGGGASIPSISTIVSASPGVSVGPSISVSRLFAAPTADSGSSSTASSFSSFVRGDDASSGEGQLVADLLLLDQAWAELDDVAEDEDAPLCDHWKGDEQSADDLALAALFEEESNWWAL